MCIYITCVVLLWVCFTSHFCNVMACFREANMIQYTWIGLFSVWCGTTVWHESVWVEKCDAVYVCRNHLFFHAFTCGAHVQLFRYLETHTAQMETYFLWYACVNVCRTLIPYIHLVRFFFRSQHLDIRTRSDFIIRRRSRRQFSYIVFVLFFFSHETSIYWLALHRFQLNFYERMRTQAS